MVCQCKLFCHFFFSLPPSFPPKLINGERKRVVIFTAKKKKKRGRRRSKKEKNEEKSTHILGLAVALIASLSLWKAISLTTFQFARWCFTARSQVTRLLHGLKALHLKKKKIAAYRREGESSYTQ